MDKQLKKIYLYIGIFVAIIFIGATYAFFTAGMSSETSTTVRADAGTMKITYDGGANINLAGIYPKDDVWATKTITVTGNNTTDAQMYYKLTLVVDSNRFSTDDPLQYELVSTNTSTNGEVISAISKTDLTETSIELGSGHFLKANNAKHTYLLKIYYPKKATSQNANQGAAFSAHVEITSAKAPTGPVFADTILANNEVKAPITTPGAAISTASEALLASVEDDYGTSYYFRGAVTNNYVEFANKCWRIVRVGGDGSVKLILHNDNTEGAANPCDSANNSASAAFARYSGGEYISAFNTSVNDNAYIGFKYGTVGSNTYAATHANTNNSTILNNLETWYNNNLKKYEKVVADTIWCNDKTNVTDTKFDPSPYGGNVTGLGYGTNKTYYGATQRLASTSNSAGGTGPSLKCNGELSKINSKVGLITADELALAGYASKLTNSTSYLQENATNTYWWSLSPLDFNLGSAGVWNVGEGSFGRSSAGSTLEVRPSISIVSFATISGGFGTSEDPYVVE